MSPYNPHFIKENEKPSPENKAYIGKHIEVKQTT